MSALEKKGTILTMLFVRKLNKAISEKRVSAEKAQTLLSELKWITPILYTKEIVSDEDLKIFLLILLLDSEELCEAVGVSTWNQVQEFVREEPKDDLPELEDEDSEDDGYTSTTVVSDEPVIVGGEDFVKQLPSLREQEAMLLSTVDEQILSWLEGSAIKKINIFCSVVVDLRRVEMMKNIRLRLEKFIRENKTSENQEPGAILFLYRKFLAGIYKDTFAFFSNDQTSNRVFASYFSEVFNLPSREYLKLVEIQEMLSRNTV